MATQIIQQGMGQQTPAVQAIIRAGIGAVRSVGRASRSRRRSTRSKAATSKKRKKRATTSSTRSRTSRSKISSMKKGSAAAKAWGKKMAKLRRK